MAAYENDNIFAKILRQEIPSHKVYEDEKTLAFMDIMPRADGHTLVIPKAPSRNILDIDQNDLASVMQTVQKMAHAVMKAFNAPGVVIQQFNEPEAGQVVFHTHFHVIPRHKDIPLRPHTGDMEKPDILAQNAEKIKKALN
jgi:histidine triad (HIT) family protein